MILLSVTGLFRTVLIILGVYLALKVIGKILQARRNVADDHRTKQQEESTKRMVNQAKENYGKTSIGKIDKSNSNDADFVDFEEIE